MTIARKTMLITLTCAVLAMAGAIAMGAGI